jgi:two-component system, cell cycle sensor histidine kinase and response regulator CckA
MVDAGVMVSRPSLGVLGEVVLMSQRAFSLQQALIAGMTDPAWMKDTESRFVAVNRALADFAGVEPDDMIGRTDHDFFSGMADSYTADDRTVLRTGQTIRRIERLVESNGAERWLETLKSIVLDDGGAVGVFGIARDITSQYLGEREQQRLNAELERQHARLNEMLGNVPGVVWEDSFDGTTRYVSDYVEVMLGYSAEEYIGRFSSVIELIHEDDRENFKRTSAAQVVGNQGGTHRFRLVRRDGRVIWCESHVSVIRNDEGKAIGMRGVSMDVTEQVASEDALRRSEELFRQVADAVPVMIWRTNAVGVTDFENKAFAGFMGASHKTGDPWLERVHPADRDRVIEAMRTAPEQDGWTQLEMLIRDHDGEYRNVFVTAAKHISKDGAFAGLVGTSIDVTEHRRLERRVEENKRMSSLGHLAARIAHEINNVLMSIRPFSELLRRSPSAEMLERIADRIASGVERGGRITHQILRYAHTAEPELQPHDVKHWLTANADELQTMLGSGVQLRLDVPENLRVLADGHQLQQVFSNLAANAKDATGGSGVFSITACTESAWTGLATREEGFVRFVVEDDGPGIPADVAARVFEPLFTTNSHGTGLGLAIVHDVICKHGGSVTVDTNPDHRGARFEIVLPATRTAPVAVPELPASWPQSVRRVLLVEDEEPVAEALALMMEMFGAETAIVNRGEKAADAIDSFRPDLVVLDVGLPDISGTEVFARIRLAHPNLPVVFATGHAGELETQIAKLEGPVGYILKPFGYASFIAAMRAVV